MPWKIQKKEVCSATLMLLQPSGAPLISRISLLALVPPVSSEAQRDFYLMASKYCPVQYTALAGKGG